MDVLDGNYNNTAVTGKKKVSFQDTFEDDDIDFDLDDPLADLLSDDDDKILENPKNSQSSSKKSTSFPLQTDSERKVEDNNDLFADEDDDILGTLGIGESSSKPTVSTKSTDNLSQLDKLLGLTGSEKPVKTIENNRRFHFDKDGNLIKNTSLNKTTSDKTASFGAYTPSSNQSRTTRRPRSGEKSPNPVVDFQQNASADPDPKSTESKSAMHKPLSLPVSIDVKAPKKEFGNAQDDKIQQADLFEKTLPKQSLSSRPPRQRIAAESSLPVPSSPVNSVSSDATKSVRDLTTDPILDILEGGGSVVNDNTGFAAPKARLGAAKPRPVVAREPVSANLLTAPQPVRSPAISTGNGVSDAHVLSLESQLSHAHSLLNEAQMGFQTDLNVTKEAYDGRIEIMRRSLEDFQSRSEREMEMIKHSFSARLELLRQQIQDHEKEVTNRDMHDHEELKRLRLLHLSSLEDTRQEYDQQMGRLKEMHLNEIEGLKKSTVLFKNMDSTVEKVDKTVSQLEEMANAHEAAFQTISKKFDTMTATNNRVLTMVQDKFEEIQRKSDENQSILLQTVCKLEGSISEMNRRMKEQQYSMQLEQTRLQQAQSSFETEKKHAFQQMELEKERASKMHSEAIDLYHSFQNEAKFEREKFSRKEQEVRLLSQKLEEARIADVGLAEKRRHEHKAAENDLTQKEIVLEEKSNKLSRMEAQLQVQLNKLDERDAALSEAENSIAQLKEQLFSREKESELLEERNAKNIMDSAQALKESKRIENEHDSRLNEIRLQNQELNQQRQLLARERKHIMEMTLNGEGNALSSILEKHTHESTPKKVQESFRKPYAFVDNNSSRTNMILWQHSAQQDREFLEDEQLFLESIRHSKF
ncbi:uncharacterized protein LOC143458766 [Clavelina lepadiformis]|uniref:uncharacterized protein LOC143458766 n=1 Tax=Clavelina lepadiformis TaxID=159417 RepID=UPI0040417D8E